MSFPDKRKTYTKRQSTADGDSSCWDLKLFNDGERRVIFLDIDGVMNCRDSVVLEMSRGVKPLSTFYKPSLDALCSIVSATGAKIVISSTWRLGHKTLESLNDEFLPLGIPDCIIGRTGKRDDGYRGKEIDDWLRANQDVWSFVIIDDDTDMEPYMSRLVKTDGYTCGLSADHIEEAIAILAREAPRT